MKKIELIEYGSAQHAFQVTEFEEQEYTSKQVLIQTYYAGIEPYDVKFRNGIFGTETQLPVVIGSSLAGVITAVGDEVEDLKVGDRVVASPHLKAYSQSVAVLARQVAKLPDEIDFKTAAAYALSGQTAYQSINEHLEVQAGDRLLISGTNGAVGYVASQLAKKIGATVIGLVRDVNGENLSAEFVDEMIDETQLGDVEFNKALDTVGGDVLEKMLTHKEALIKSLLAEDQNIVIYMKSSGASLDALNKLIPEMKIPVAYEYEFSKDGVVQAHLDFENRVYENGKEVIKIK